MSTVTLEAERKYPQFKALLSKAGLHLMELHQADKAQWVGFCWKLASYEGEPWDQFALAMFEGTARRPLLKYVLWFDPDFETDGDDLAFLRLANAFAKFAKGDYPELQEITDKIDVDDWRLPRQDYGADT